MAVFAPEEVHDLLWGCTAGEKRSLDIPAVDCGDAW